VTSMVASAPDTPGGPRMFSVALDSLDGARATFRWRDGETVDEVVVSVPRAEWENAARPVAVTVTLRDPLQGAR
jgi:hypothetical protein